MKCKVVTFPTKEPDKNCLDCKGKGYINCVGRQLYCSCGFDFSKPKETIKDIKLKFKVVG